MKKAQAFPRWIWPILALLLLLFYGVDRFFLSPEAENTPLPSGTLSVHFLNVGQGDAAFAVLPDGQTLLIDGGDVFAGEAVLAFLKAQNVSKIDILVATHPHADHIGGLPAVLEALPVGKIYMPKVSHTTKTFETLLETIQAKGLTIQTAKAGVSLASGEGFSVSLLGPISETYESLNDYSAIVRLVYGERVFLFMGDAEKTSEGELVDMYGSSLAADVVKAGHHGSRTSSTKEFIQASAPAYVVFSLGASNDYGHPHESVWNAWAKTGAALLRTDASGTISFQSDGTNLTMTAEKP